MIQLHSFGADVVCPKCRQAVRALLGESPIDALESGKCQECHTALAPQEHKSSKPRKPRHVAPTVEQSAEDQELMRGTLTAAVEDSKELPFSDPPVEGEDEQS